MNLFSLSSSLRWLLVAASVAALGACSGLRYIPENEKLYTGATAKIVSPEKLKNESVMNTELTSVIRPKPNASILGLRPKLYFWHLGVGKTKGLGKKIADKFGEAPVLLSQVKISATENLMLNRLYNHGFFEGKVTHEVKEDTKTAKVNYTATVTRAYTIHSVNFPPGDTVLNAAIRATQPASLLKVGDDYDLNTFTAERIRIDAVLKNEGYYYFTPDALLFEVDSTIHKQVDVFVTVKGSYPARSRVPYTLRRVSLNTNYILTDTTTREPIMADGYRYYPDEEVFKAKAITRATFLYPDSVFRRRRRDQTLSRLMSLGTFKFVEIRFNPSTPADSLAGPSALENGRGIGVNRPQLDATVLMTQLRKKNLRAEVQLVSKTSGFTGPGITATFRNRSALRGAEQLLVNLVGAFETQTNASNNALGVTSTEIGINTQLLIPRLVVPKFLNPGLTNSDFQPRTAITLGYKTVNRTNFFREDFFNMSYGYVFKTKITNEQQFNPIDVQYVRLANTTSVFDSVLDARPFLKNSFRQQFILASSYRYTYNQQVLEQRRQQIYFSGGVEVSGNLASAVTSNSSRDELGLKTIAGQAFSQYAKFDLELREYFRISADPAKGNRIVGRLLIGAGLPYGNSDVLPYLKQYGIGGPNSVRAFAARQLGPGTYRPASTNTSSFYDQVGDLRLEGNIEYRQDLFPYVKGALFLDAGNIWLVNDDPTRPGGQFNSSTFLNQLAVGAGAGIRIDVQFFVIRFDYAIPLRAGYGTPTNDDGTVDRTGRLSLAIGYPF